MTRLRCVSLYIVGCLTFVAGCGGGPEGPTRYEVSGTVTLDGKSLDEGTIRFEPQSPPNIGGGAVIENGKYTVPEENGLPAGKYVVRIYAAAAAAPVEAAPGEVAPPAPERIPANFNTESQETIEVAVDKPNTFDFQIP